MAHPSAINNDRMREERRARVSAILLSGIRDQTRIAQQLGVSQSTISRDIKHLEGEWQKSAVQDIAAAKGQDLERTERLIAALWSDAIKGKWLATDRVLALMQHRAKLLGLNAPEKREETQRIEITTMVRKIAEESGLSEGEILAEAERILAGVD